MIFEIGPDVVHRWKITSVGDPELKQSIAIDKIEDVFIDKRTEWSPERIFRAKALASSIETSLQLDFIDLGLMPALEGMIHEKLDRLLRNILAMITNTYEGIYGERPDVDQLFPLVFRLIAAKVLRDRGHQGGWDSDNAAFVLEAVENYYSISLESLLSSRISNPEVLGVAWHEILSAFHFQNLSVDDLAFIYENTLITDETRKQFGIHSTPRQVAEYIIQKLPFEYLAPDQRRVLEPCAGHGVFLIAAMRRLRELLPSDLTDAQRHEYFVKNLVGIEIDPFALEVCRLSLVLADYPNPDGWQLYNENVFTTGRLERELQRAEIVLCNPPFEEFTSAERAELDSYGFLQKPAELLQRVLKNPPKLLGVVLPRVFTFGLTYLSLHRQLAEVYARIELIALPEVFNYSYAPTILLIASECEEKHREVVVTRREVSKQESVFLSPETEPSGHTEALAIAGTHVSTFTLWSAQLSELWHYLELFPKLGTQAVIHQGIHWKGRKKPYKQREPRTDVISDVDRPGYKKGYARVRGSLRQYSIRGFQYLSLRPEDQHDEAYLYDWGTPKVVCNAARLQKTRPWRVGAVVDPEGAAFSKQFFAFWPKESISLYALAAVLNSPVASAYCFEIDQERDNRIQTLKRLPIPPVSELAPGGIIDSLSQEIHQRFQEIHENQAFIDAYTLENLILKIDATILQAYDLPSTLETDLLSLFAGVPRPVANLTIDNYDEQYERAKSIQLAELRQTSKIVRYQELVTREFSTGLGTDEAEEMERLGNEIDSYYDPFYQRILADLQ
jgi:type I restriction-modification system DNA methylase subunit